MKEFVTDIWELNKKRSYMTLDICLEMMETIQLLRDLCSNHQDATKNYEKTLRIIKKLIKQTFLDGNDKNPANFSPHMIHKINKTYIINVKFVRSRQPGIISLISYSLLWFVKINTELLRGEFTTQRFDTPV